MVDIQSATAEIRRGKKIEGINHRANIYCPHLLRRAAINSNTSSTCHDNMVNFGALAAEIGSGVRGTAANFNGFRALAALLHGTQVVGVSQTASAKLRR